MVTLSSPSIIDIMSSFLSGRFGHTDAIQETALFLSFPREIRGLRNPDSLVSKRVFYMKILAYLSRVKADRLTSRMVSTLEYLYTTHLQTCLHGSPNHTLSVGNFRTYM